MVDVSTSTDHPHLKQSFNIYYRDLRKSACNFVASSLCFYVSLLIKKHCHIDKIENEGYIAEDGDSVLVSVEKKKIEISEKVNDRINKAFEKHGKKAAVIEQELNELENSVSKELDDLAKKYGISKGKANLIGKIREEFPELDEKELADLRVNDLGMMLEDTSDGVKEHFKRIGEAIKVNI